VPFILAGCQLSSVESQSKLASNQSVGRKDASPGSPATLILVEPGEFFWRVNSITVQWNVTQTRNQGRTSSTNWSFENSSDFVKKINVGVKNDVGGSWKSDLGLHLPKANASLYANVSVWAEGNLAWGSSQQTQARRCYEEFNKEVVETTEPKVTFSIVFYNTSTNDYEIVSDNIPICINEIEQVAHAKPHKDYTRGNTTATIVIPARRPTGVSIPFVADLDNSKALTLVEYMQTHSPSITLESSQTRIHKRGQSPDADIIPDVEELKNNSVPLSIKTDATLVSWRINKSSNANLKTVFDAINEKMARAISDKRWIDYNDNGILGVADAKNSESQTWKLLINGQDVKMGNPASVIVNQPIELCLFLNPPAPDLRTPPGGSQPNNGPPSPHPTVNRSDLIGTWKWRDGDRTLIATLNSDGSVYFVNKADHPGISDFADGKGTWTLDNEALTAVVDRVGRFGVYIKYGPLYLIQNDPILKSSADEMQLGSGKALVRTK